MMIKKILCPTDFSEGSLEAISFASDIAVHAGAEVYLLHVIPIVPALVTDPSFAFTAPEMERSVSSEVQAELKTIAEPLCCKGSSSAKVYWTRKFSCRDRAHRRSRAGGGIVIATYGKTGWRRLVLSSVAEKVVRLATCPVVTFERGPVQRRTRKS